MFFKKLRSRSKSSSQSTKPSIDRVTSSSSTTKDTPNNDKDKIVESEMAVQGEAGEDSDYKEFLEKARREAERKEREMVRSIARARETNLSPWAGRM